MRTRYLIELCGFEPRRLKMAEREIWLAQPEHAEWRVWHYNMLWVGVKPNVSVIDSHGRTRNELFTLVNDAHCTNIFIVGTDAPRIGLPVLDDGFRWIDVVMADETEHSFRSLSEPFAETMPGDLPRRAPPGGP